MSQGIFDARVTPSSANGSSILALPGQRTMRHTNPLQRRCMSMSLPVPQYRASIWEHCDEEATFYQALMEASLQPSVARAPNVEFHPGRLGSWVPPGLPGRRRCSGMFHHGCWLTLKGHGMFQSDVLSFQHPEFATMQHPDLAHESLLQGSNHRGARQEINVLVQFSLSHLLLDFYDHN